MLFAIGFVGRRPTPGEDVNKARKLFGADFTPMLLNEIIPPETDLKTVYNGVFNDSALAGTSGFVRQVTVGSATADLEGRVGQPMPAARNVK